MIRGISSKGASGGGRAGSSYTRARGASLGACCVLRELHAPGLSELHFHKFLLRMVGDELLNVHIASAHSNDQFSINDFSVDLPGTEHIEPVPDPRDWHRTSERVDELSEHAVDGVPSGSSVVHPVTRIQHLFLLGFYFIHQSFEIKQSLHNPSDSLPYVLIANIGGLVLVEASWLLELLQHLCYFTDIYVESLVLLRQLLVQVLAVLKLQLHFRDLALLFSGLACLLVRPGPQLHHVVFALAELQLDHRHLLVAHFLLGV